MTEIDLIDIDFTDVHNSLIAHIEREDDPLASLCGKGLTVVPGRYGRNIVRSAPSSLLWS